MPEETPTIVASYQRGSTIHRVMEHEGRYAEASVFAQPGSGYAYSIDRVPQTFSTVAAAQAAADADMTALLTQP